MDSSTRCPHCGAEHPPGAGRFCDSCGMSVERHVRRDDADAEAADERPLVRCRYCGVKGPPPVCPACGQRLPLPDDWKD